MPLYTYECAVCKAIFDKRHSIKERLSECSSCGTREQLNRIPPVPFILKKEKDKPSKVGGAVKDFIEEAQQDLKRDKEKLQQREMK